MGSLCILAEKPSQAKAYAEAFEVAKREIKAMQHFSRL